MNKEVVIAGQQRGLQEFSMQDLSQMARAFAASGLFGCKTEAQAFALMLVAQAEGRHPATVAQDYDIIGGRPAIRANSALARFQAAGGSIRWIERNDKAVEAEFSHPQGGTLSVRWDMDRAAKAGLTGKDNWKHYPAQMLSARVASEGVRAVFPACLNGMYVVEEVRDIIDESGAPAKRPDPAREIPTASKELQPEPTPTEFVTFENATKLMEKAAVVGISLDEALKIAEAPSIKLIPREKGLAIAMEITRRRNEIAKAATQKDAAPATPDAAAGAVDAESELFGDGEGAQ